MPRLLEPLWLVLISYAEKQLAQMIEYLREENRNLQGKLPKRLTLTARERNRLIKYGSMLGPAINSLITIVSHRTFMRWMNELKGPAKAGKPKRNSGRPRTESEIRDLILRFPRENSWGYSRILGELKKLGVQSVCRSMVVNILKETGFDPSPKRGKGTWWEFLERHQKTLWASDFLSVKSLTTNGFVDLFVLFFIHPGTRRVIVSGITANPNSAWMKQQARNVTGEIRDLGFLVSEVLIIDHDTKYTREFDAIFESEGTEVKRVGPIAPNLNAYAERFAQTLRVECLDHFVVCGEKHLRFLVTEFLEHYHDERPHQSLDNVPPCRPSEKILPFEKTHPVHRTERLGGFLKHYSRKFA
jgi:putative transposase